jgi:peptide/nickel transport system substrate-binding protein
VKNEDYYLDGKPYLDEVYYHVIPDGASRAVAYETGTVDVLHGGSIENFDIERLRPCPTPASPMPAGSISVRTAGCG